MKTKILPAVLSIVVASLLTVVQSNYACASDQASAANIFLYPKPYKVEDLVLNNSFGQTLSLKDFRGKVVILHFWSINCPACRMEEPLLEQLKRSFGPSGLEILAVNLVDSPQAIANHLGKNQLSFPVLFDGGRGFQIKVLNMAGKATAFVVNPSHEAILEVPGFPTTYIVDCRGSAVGYSVGCARWDSVFALNLIHKLVTESKTCMLGSAGSLGQAGSRVGNWGLKFSALMD
jgi:thiol-disulfide isomerase/thioredoxin